MSFLSTNALNYALLILPHALNKYTHFTPFCKYHPSNKKTVDIENRIKWHTKYYLILAFNGLKWNPAIQYVWQKVKFLRHVFSRILQKVTKFYLYGKRMHNKKKTRIIILGLNMLVLKSMAEIGLQVLSFQNRTLHLIYSFYPTTHFTPPYPILHF